MKKLLTPKIVMIGVMLVGMFSCKKAPTIKNPVTTYVVNQKFNEAAVGPRDLNYKNRKNSVGEWIGEPTFISLSEAPETMFCMSLEDWLKKVKPTLKAGSIFFSNRRN